MSRTLILAGRVAAELLWPVPARLGLGRLPGVFERAGMTSFVLIATMITFTVAMSVLFRLFGR